MTTNLKIGDRVISVGSGCMTYRIVEFRDCDGKPYARLAYDVTVKGETIPCAGKSCHRDDADPGLPLDWLSKTVGQ